MAKKHRNRQIETKPAAVPARHRTVDFDQQPYPRLAIFTLFLLPLVFYARFLTGSVMLFGTDFIGAGGYAAHQFMSEYIKRHLTIALWQPQILCGQPTVAAFFGDLFYPTILLRLLFPVHIVWAWTFYIHTFLAGLGTYLFLKELKLNTIAAFLAGVAYMFSGSLLTLAYAGHDGRLIGSALMPVALFFLCRGINRRQFLLFILTGFILGLQLLSGHIQKVYYTVLLLIAYFVFVFIRTIKQEHNPKLALRLLLYFIIGSLFAVCLAAIQYLPIYGNLPYGARGAERGYEFATSWSMPIAEIFDLLTPHFSGSLWQYWSKNPFKLHSEYLGILPLIFALVAIFQIRKKAEVKFFLITLIITILMAWGGNTPFYRIPYHLLPGIAKFRGPGMIFFIAGFSIAVLAGYGINHLLTSDEQKGQKIRKSIPRVLIYGGAVILLFFLIALIARGFLAGIFNPGPRLPQFEANYPSFTTGLLFTLLIWILGCLLIYLLNRNRLAPLPFTIIVALIMTLDIGISLKLWNNNQGYIRSLPPPQEYFAPDEVVRFLKADTTFYRVLPLNYERSDEGELWLHNIFSTGGQIPNPLQTYQDFIGAGKSVMFQANNLLNPNFMNLLNVKYIITYNLPDDASSYDAQTQQFINQLKLYFSQPQFKKAFTGARYAIYENSDYLPRAFIVKNWEIVQNKDQLLARLMQPDFDPAHTALLYENPGMALTPDSSYGTVRIAHYDANRIIVQASLTTPGLLILSENYHPDWKVIVNGKPAKLLQAYHTLRAVMLTEGEHQIEFRHQPRYYTLGIILTLFSTLFLIIILLVQIFQSRHNRKPKADAR
ncbi:YfhO family protein [candidate division WOR-3 bacterium]|nr:YfhO family protein [candidate division WOR-3 bacterium]